MSTNAGTNASDLLTIKDAMTFLGLSTPVAVHGWIKNNGVPKIKKETRTYVRKSDILVALERREKAKAESGDSTTAKKGAFGRSEHVRPDDADLINVKEAMELLGHKNAPTTLQWIEKYGLKQKIDGRVYISKKLLVEAIDGGVDVVPKAKKDKVEPPNPFSKFVANPKVVAWNKGTHRGWAFAAVRDVSPATVTLVTDYGKSYLWPHTTVATSIAKGEFFMAEPHMVLKFLETQLLLVKDTDDDMPSIIKDLHSLAERLEKIKLKSQPQTVNVDVDVDVDKDEPDIETVGEVEEEEEEEEEENG